MTSKPWADLPTHVRNCLLRSGLRTADDIRRWDPRDLRDIRGFGAIAYDTLRGQYPELGLPAMDYMGHLRGDEKDPHPPKRPRCTCGPCPVHDKEE